MKILVTGGTGLVGSTLIHLLLEKGYTDLRVLARAKSDKSLLGSKRDELEWVVGDLLDLISLEEAMCDIDIVFHCAALVSFVKKDAKKILEMNLQGTANVVNIALHQKVDRFIHVSSIAALNGDVQSIDEQSYFNYSSSYSTYGLSKFLAEQEVWRGFAEGLKGAIVNPGIILGAGFWNSGPLGLIKMIDKGFPFYPTGITGFVDVRDVAEFMIHAFENQLNEERYVLVAENASYQKVLSSIAKNLGKNPPQFAIHPILRKTVSWGLRLGSLFGLQPALISPESLEGSAKRNHYNNSKSLQIEDFCYRPLEETIYEMVEAYFKSKEQKLPFGSFF
jgi:dihydroflavonol-4-reductase